MRKLRHAALSLLISALLSTCTLVPQTEPVRVFLLPAENLDVSDNIAVLDLALRIRTPRASGALDSPYVAVVRGNQISRYQGARWSDSAPALLRDRLVEAFIRSGRLSSVSDEDASLQADVTLNSNLRAFQSQYIDGEPHALIRLDARLISAQELLTSRRFEVSVPARSADLEAVIDAFGEAGDTLSREVLDWALARLAEAEGPAAG